MPTRHRVDLVNLLEATCDILVDAGILADDNSNIVAAHDGSRVEYDKYNPRVEITISPINTEV
jgi:Holliday junction resolvase RusA-like endonuclease